MKEEQAGPRLKAGVTLFLFASFFVTPGLTRGPASF